jgi:hypothetical protein
MLIPNPPTCPHRAGLGVSDSTVSSWLQDVINTSSTGNANTQEPELPDCRVSLGE